MKTGFDVIVVGGGGAGLAAAASSAERGLSVLLLEKQPQLGGTTGIAVGSFTTSCTTYQQKAGIQDRLDHHVEDAGKFARPEIEARNNPALRSFFLSHATDTLNWLVSKGIAFYGPSPEPPNRVPRMHNVVPNAKAYIATLQAVLLRHGGTILCNAAVERLTNDNGRVAGVMARVRGEERAFRAGRGVVLAAGDYANSPAIIARYKGKQYAHIEGINPDATGGGHVLAEAADAKMVNMDVTYGPELRFVPPREGGFEQFLPAQGPAARAMSWLIPFVPKFIINSMIKRLLVTWQHPDDSLLENGAILVNHRGERFCNEKVWPDREIAIAQQPDKVCYIVLDQRLIDRYNAWPHFISTAPEIAYAYVNDYLRLRPDVSVEARSLSELARGRDIPEHTLQQTVHAYNRYVRGDEADVFGRTGDTDPLQGARWVLLGPAKAYFTTTEGSPAINEKLQVLDEAEQPIRGLYAVGQNGLGGQILWGHGLHIAWAMTSGRLVGSVLSEV